MFCCCYEFIFQSKRKINKQEFTKLIFLRKEYVVEFPPEADMPRVYISISFGQVHLWKIKKDDSHEII